MKGGKIMNEKTSVIQQHEENTWFLINTDNGEIENVITKDGVIEYCKHECEDEDPDFVNADDIITNALSKMLDDYNWDYADHYCEEFDKFTAWLSYICVEYLANEIVASYKQRLLDFE